MKKAVELTSGVQLTSDLSATIVSHYDGDVTLNLSERGMEGLGGYHWETMSVSGREVLSKLRDLIDEALSSTT